MTSSKLAAPHAELTGLSFLWCKEVARSRLNLTLIMLRFRHMEMGGWVPTALWMKDNELVDWAQQIIPLLYD